MSKFFDYLETLSQINGLNREPGKGQKIQWLFHCGMLFSSIDKWWGDFQFRKTVHEGIDITYFRMHPNDLNHFDPSVLVPAMDDGKILNVCSDFLGRTLVVEHKCPTLFNRHVVFVYAHIEPDKRIKTGDCIKKNEVIARVCDTHKNPQLPPHLHFSCFEISRQIPPEHLNWQLFSKGLEVNMIHPLSL